MTTELKDAEIFAAGTWNRQPFTDADLDGIVSSFAALNLSGRVPLKLGHDGADARTDDGAPALGWVEAIKRVGSKLLADIKLTSDKLAEGIRNGAYRFCSVELLQGVKADTREIPWVLDGVALLGASQPAVGTLRDLAQSLQPMSRTAVLQFTDRVAFSYQPVDELAQTKAELKATMEKSHMQSVIWQIEIDIATGLTTPATREAFFKLMKLDAKKPATFSEVTVGDWATFLRTQPKARFARVRPTSLASDGSDSSIAGERPDAEVVRLINIEVLAQGGKTTDFEARRRAMTVVFKRDPALANRYYNIQDW